MVEIDKEITEHVANNKQLIVLFFVQEYVGNVLLIKVIQDKNIVPYFWLTNFSLLFAADFQANPTELSWDQLQKVMRKYTTLFCSVRPKPGVGIGNQIQGPISVSEPKLFFLKPKPFFSKQFKFMSYFPTSWADVDFYKLEKNLEIFSIWQQIWF